MSLREASIFSGADDWPQRVLKKCKGPPGSTEVQRFDVISELYSLMHADTIFLVDDLTSMQGLNWYLSRSALIDIAHASTECDSSGVDTHLLDGKTPHRWMNSRDRVLAKLLRVVTGDITLIGS